MNNEFASQSKPDGVILFSGFNQRSVVAMCRTLKACNINFHIIAHTQEDTIFKTKYSSNIATVRNNPLLDIKDLCNSIEFVRAGSSKKFVIAPTSEAMNTFLMRHRKRVEKAGDILPLVSEKLYHMITGKDTFAARCQEYSIPGPAELPPFEDPTLPVVAKPRTEATADGWRLYPLLLYTNQDWEKFTSMPDRGKYFIQPHPAGNYRKFENK